MILRGRGRHASCLFEVLMACLMLDIGLRVAFSPSIVLGSNMAFITQTFGVEIIAVVCIAIGSFRTMVMMFEERVGRNGVYYRLGAALLSCLIWTTFVVSFFETFVSRGAPLPPGFDMLTAQSIGEMAVAFQLGRELR